MLSRDWGSGELSLLLLPVASSTPPTQGPCGEHSLVLARGLLGLLSKPTEADKWISCRERFPMYASERMKKYKV